MEAVSLTQAIDVRSPDHDPWSALQPPRGWAPIAETCHRLRQRLDAVAVQIVDRIAEEIPGYANFDGVPRTDVELSVLRNADMMLAGIAERRGPLPDELVVRRELGRRRAEQGIPVDALLDAYHVGYRELWDELISESRRVKSAASQLPTAASTLWGWIHQVTRAVAEAHQETTRGLELLLARNQQRFVEILLSGDVASEEALNLARSLGFNPESTFQVLCIGSIREHAGSQPDHIQRALSAAGGRITCASSGGNVVAVCQATDEDAVVRIAAAAQHIGAVGIGLKRSGLDGARLSLGDSTLAYELAKQEGRTIAFENDWVGAILNQSAHRLLDLLGDGAHAAHRYPHLAEAVHAYASEGFSMAGASRKLSVHLNTLIYRLDRWTTLTGWDPRTEHGLMCSLAATRLPALRTDVSESGRRRSHPDRCRTSGITTVTN